MEKSSVHESFLRNAAVTYFAEIPDHAVEEEIPEIGVDRSIHRINSSRFQKLHTEIHPDNQANRLCSSLSMGQPHRSCQPSASLYQKQHSPLRVQLRSGETLPAQDQIRARCVTLQSQTPYSMPVLKDSIQSLPDYHGDW